MKAHMPHAKLAVAALQLALPIRAQGERRVSAPDRMLPDVWEWYRLLGERTGKAGHALP